MKKEKESKQSNFIINNVTDGKKSRLYLLLSFPGASSIVIFECDTGSYYTLIRKELLPKGYKLGPAPEQLNSATGHPLKAIGTTRIKMTYKGEKVPLGVVVVEGPAFEALLGTTGLDVVVPGWREAFRA